MSISAKNFHSSSYLRSCLFVDICHAQIFENKCPNTFKTLKKSRWILQQVTKHCKIHLKNAAGELLSWRLLVTLLLFYLTDNKNNRITSSVSLLYTVLFQTLVLHSYPQTPPVLSTLPALYRNVHNACVRIVKLQVYPGLRSLLLSHNGDKMSVVWTGIDERCNKGTMLAEKKEKKRSKNGFSTAIVSV